MWEAENSWNDTAVFNAYKHIIDTLYVPFNEYETIVKKKGEILDSATCERGVEGWFSLDVTESFKGLTNKSNHNGLLLTTTSEIPMTSGSGKLSPIYSSEHSNIANRPKLWLKYHYEVTETVAESVKSINSTNIRFRQANNLLFVNILHLNSIAQKNVAVTLFDLQGRVVKRCSPKANGGMVKFHISNLSCGKYFVKVKINGELKLICGSFLYFWRQ